MKITKPIHPLPLPSQRELAQNLQHWELEDRYYLNFLCNVFDENFSRIEVNVTVNLLFQTSEVKEQEVIRTTTKRVEATPAPVKREKPWDIPPIQCDEPEDGIFYAQMGPTGGKHGYSAITGKILSLMCRVTHFARTYT